MKLITKAIENRLKRYPLYSQDGMGGDATAICKFFAPTGRWTWYVTEAERQGNNDYEFFGLVINGYGEKEYGYFTLSELEGATLPMGLKIERDKGFLPTKLSKINQIN
ncbi:MAG: DUF2958 domain-containing protein [Bacteroidales bacterium]|jgi:hypothetical protein|nr:DUF2958 domain-containing protein [Bacteroidales bacterium]